MCLHEGLSIFLYFYECGISRQMPRRKGAFLELLCRVQRERERVKSIQFPDPDSLAYSVSVYSHHCVN